MNVLLTAILVCSAAAGAEPAAVPTTELIEADNKFGVKVFNYLTDAKPQENVFISPLGIALALQMTAHGAAGATWDAMAGAMNLSGLSQANVAAGNLKLRAELAGTDGNARLDIANSLWLRKGVMLREQFADDCGKCYRASVTTLDFARPDAAAAINDWVADSTGGRIRQIVSRLESEEILVLLNAVCFKGIWQTEFDPKLTSPREFHLASGSAQRRMMNRQGTFRYKEDDAMQAIVLPCGDGRLSMYIFLPRENDGLGGLIDAIGPEDFADLSAGFEEREGKVILPRFKIEYEQNLVKTLRALGMEQAFAAGADFSRMVVPPASVAISYVLHKTFVEVNEEGTEAAAATLVAVKGPAPPPEEERFSFVCDHPFLCAVRDDATGSVLFLGAIFDPKQ